MFKNLTIKARLVGVIVFLSLLAASLGLLGIRGMSSANDGLKTVYEDRTAGLRYLALVERSLSSSRLQIANALLNRTPDVTQNAITRLEASVAAEKKAWAAYLATAATPEEKKLSDQFEQQLQRIGSESVQPAIALLRKGDLDALHALYTKPDIRKLNTDARATLEKLATIQTDVAKEVYDDAVGRYQTTRNTVLTAMAVSALIAALVGYFLVRAIVLPLNRAVSLADAVASGDLTQRIECDRNDETGRLLQALKRMNESLSQLVHSVRTGVDTISTGSQQIASGNADLSQRTEEQASSLEETASSMEELASTVKQNAENATNANTLAGTASQVAAQGGAVVHEVVQTMAQIHDSSRKISDIIGVIDGIAFQTNILALNAAVEAARAGEQGRGFAVVASEVRTLAQRSASAAKEIKELISESVGKVEAGTRLVNSAGETMQQVVESVQRVSEVMADIAAATKEQSSGIEQVNEAVTQMDQVTQQNAALVEEAAAAAESMKEQAQQLSTAVAVFKVDSAAAGIERAGAADDAAPRRAERRSLPRPANVARLPRRVGPKATADTAPQGKTGTHDWSEF